jgi:hypothetical protein
VHCGRPRPLECVRDLRGGERVIVGGGAVVCERRVKCGVVRYHQDRVASEGC